jgi:hypothetical protein
MKPIHLGKNDKMPADFWNYRVNPIVGFYIEPQHRNSIRTERKYGLTPVSINNKQ